MPIVTYWFNRDCEHYCTRGQRCILMRYEPHKLHICRDPECDCHTEERYREGKENEHKTDGGSVG
jgi:hypothetical protein